ncbi:hypothetical protein L0F63_006322 [Massospora cicadina]|nr:hypothetical protein L0F63_006322 [Massospora cicadina]
MLLTRLAAEQFNFDSESIHLTNLNNQLRPKLVESLFYAYRETHEEKYRDAAWEIFQGFLNYSKARFGFTKYQNVLHKENKFYQKDVMQSHFLAETLKYLYLIFSPDETLNLNRRVFNTKGHPLKIQTSNKV